MYNDEQESQVDLSFQVSLSFSITCLTKNSIVTLHPITLLESANTWFTKVPVLTMDNTQKKKKIRNSKYTMTNKKVKYI